MTDLLQPTAREHFKTAVEMARQMNSDIQSGLLHSEQREAVLRQCAESMGVVVHQIILGLEQIEAGRI